MLDGKMLYMNFFLSILNYMQTANTLTILIYLYTLETNGTGSAMFNLGNIILRTPSSGFGGRLIDLIDIVGPTNLQFDYYNRISGCFGVNTCEADLTFYTRPYFNKYDITTETVDVPIIQIQKRIETPAPKVYGDSDWVYLGSGDGDHLMTVAQTFQICYGTCLCAPGSYAYWNPMSTLKIVVSSYTHYNFCSLLENMCNKIYEVPLNPSPEIPYIAFVSEGENFRKTIF